MSAIDQMEPWTRRQARCLRSSRASFRDARDVSAPPSAPERLRQCSEPTPRASMYSPNKTFTANAVAGPRTGQTFTLKGSPSRVGTISGDGRSLVASVLTPGIEPSRFRTAKFYIALHAFEHLHPAACRLTFAIERSETATGKQTRHDGCSKRRTRADLPLGRGSRSAAPPREDVLQCWFCMLRRSGFQGLGQFLPHAAPIARSARQ